jgi:uncharacterized OsmC-like protein
MMSEPIVQQVRQRADPAEAGMSLQAVQKREVVVRLEAQSLERMRKQAVVTVEQPRGSTFSIVCDEGPYLNGDDSAPPPLSYYSAGIAFCLLTQLSRYAAIAKLKIRNMTLRQETRFAMEGSALKGTLTGRGLLVDTVVEIDSDEPPERIAELVRIGRQSCFVHQSVEHPVPTQTSILLNGRPLDPGEPPTG